MKRLKRRKRSGPGALMKHRAGGLNFFELIIGTLIITVTSVAVASSFYSAYNHMTRQRWRMKANQLLKAEAEFWLGRVHSAFPSVYELQHPIPNPEGPFMLDPYRKGNQLDRGATGEGGIPCETGLLRIRPVDKMDTLAKPDWFEIQVYARYTEPPLDLDVTRRYGRAQGRNVNLKLIVPFIQSSI